MPTAPIETALFKARNASTPRMLQDHVGDVLNVKSFGALGTGSADDTLAIQRCFDTAFGGTNSTDISDTTPHGVTNAWKNRSVFFPNGQYKILGTLQLTDVYGATIFGSGKDVTYLVPGTTGSGATAGLVVNTILATNGFSFSCIRDMTLGTIGGGNPAPGIVMIDLDWLGSNSAGLGNNLLLNLGFGSPNMGGVGVRLGHSTSTQGAGHQLIQTAAGGNPCLLQEGAGCTNTLIQNGAWGGLTTVKILGGSIAIQSLVLTRSTTSFGVDISSSLPCSITDCRTEQAEQEPVGTHWPNNTFLRVTSPSQVYVSGISTSESTNTLPHFADLSGNATVIFDPMSVYGDVIATAGCNVYFRGVNMPNVNFTTLSGLGVVRQHI